MSLEEEAALLLKEKGYTICTAESCTGGLLAGRLINVGGISDCIKEGYITYANAAKEKLVNVKHETLEKYGAVSEQTAAEMAEGARIAGAAQVGLSTTGIAGPDGGTKEKPVGLVYMGCSVNGKVAVERHVFDGDRMQVRTQAVEAALELLKKQVAKY